MSAVDAVIIQVPAPLSKNRDPDISLAWFGCPDRINSELPQKII